MSKQLTLKEMKERGEKFPPNSAGNKITERIPNFIVMDEEPLSVVGDGC